MEFVDGVIPEIQAAPALVLPGEAGGRHLGRSVDALGLKAGSRVRPVLGPVQAVEVTGPRPHPGHHSLEVTGLALLQRDQQFSRGDQAHFQALAPGGPDPEGAAALSQGDGSQVAERLGQQDRTPISTG